MPQFSQYYAVRDYPFTNAANQCCDGQGGTETKVLVTGNYTVVPDDLPVFLELAPDNGTSITVTLPYPLASPPDGGAGSYVTAVDIVGIQNVGATVTFNSADDPAGSGQSSTIDNASTFDFTGNFQGATFVPETTNPNWLVT